MNLDYPERDKLRKDIVSILSNIQPAISPTAFSILLHPVSDSVNDCQTVTDLYVAEVKISEMYTDDLYFTGGHEAFIKTDAGKKKLSGLALQDEILRRLQSKVKSGVSGSAYEYDEAFGFSSVLRRAKLVEPALKEAQLLWVDDNPGNNIYERMTLKSMGISVELALSTDEAMHMLMFESYDAIISDMERFGKADAGLQLLSTLRANNINTPLVFYTWRLDEQSGTPFGAFGITRYPEDLMHLILDILERFRL